MRLNEIRCLITDNLNQIKFSHARQSNGTIEITGFQRAIGAIENLKELRFLGDEYNSIVNLGSIYHNKTTYDKVIVDDDTYPKFNSAINSIKEKVNSPPPSLAFRKGLPGS